MATAAGIGAILLIKAGVDLFVRRKTEKETESARPRTSVTMIVFFYAIRNY